MFFSPDFSHYSTEPAILINQDLQSHDRLFDAILALMLLSELHSEFQNPFHATFVDLKSAFDSVDHAALQLLAQKGKGFPLSTPVI